MNHHQPFPTVVVNDDDDDDDDDDHHHDDCRQPQQQRLHEQEEPLFRVQHAREGLLEALAGSGGYTDAHPKFDACLAILQQHYHTHNNMSTNQEEEEGLWLTLTAPHFVGMLGRTHGNTGDPLYTLGRMTFHLFAPTHLVCSLQGSFNHVQRIVWTHNDVEHDEQRLPQAVRQAWEQSRAQSMAETKTKDTKSVLRTYHIATAFTIEPSASEMGDLSNSSNSSSSPSSSSCPNHPNRSVRRPIRGILTTYGYTLPDPQVPHRHSLWMTGARIEPNTQNNGHDTTTTDTTTDSCDDNCQLWQQLFFPHGPSQPQPLQRPWSERLQLLALQLFMGATVVEPQQRQSMVDNHDHDGNRGSTGSRGGGGGYAMEYAFTRPLGGHGVAYLDTLFCDASLRIVRGHRGTLFVFTRLPQPTAQS